MVEEHNFRAWCWGQTPRFPSSIPILDGRVIFIRFIRSDRKLDVFGEKFMVARNLSNIPTSRPS